MNQNYTELKMDRLKKKDLSLTRLFFTDLGVKLMFKGFGETVLLIKLLINTNL